MHMYIHIRSESVCICTYNNTHYIGGILFSIPERTHNASSPRGPARWSELLLPHCITTSNFYHLPMQSSTLSNNYDLSHLTHVEQAVPRGRQKLDPPYMQYNAVYVILLVRKWMTCVTSIISSTNQW